MRYQVADTESDVADETMYSEHEANGFLLNPLDLLSPKTACERSNAYTIRSVYVAFCWCFRPSFVACLIVFPVVWHLKTGWFFLS